MAILVYFERVRDDAGEVEYAYGFPELDRRLVIDKASQDARPLDGKVDLHFRCVYAKVLRTHRDQAVWLERGVYAA